MFRVLLPAIALLLAAAPASAAPPAVPAAADAASSDMKQASLALLDYLANSGELDLWAEQAEHHLASIAPNDAAIAYQLGVHYFYTGDRTRAEELLLRAVGTLNPQATAAERVQQVRRVLDGLRPGGSIPQA